MDERRASPSVFAGGRSPTEHTTKVPERLRQAGPASSFSRVSSLRYTTQAAPHAPKFSAWDKLIRKITSSKNVIFVEKSSGDSCWPGRGLQQGFTIEQPTRRQHPRRLPGATLALYPEKILSTCQLTTRPVNTLSLVSGTRCRGRPSLCRARVLWVLVGKHEVTTDHGKPLGIVHTPASLQRRIPPPRRQDGERGVCNPG